MRRKQRSGRLVARGTDAAEVRPRRRRSPWWRRAALALLAAVAIGCSADMSRGPEPVEECASYAHSLERCLGGQRSKSMVSQVYAESTPRSDADRARMATKCREASARLERACR